MKPSVLLVPDLLHWVTAKIGLAIAAGYGQKYNFSLVSERVLFEKLQADPDFLHQFALVHALTPHIATRLGRHLSPSTKLIATVHHVEDERSVEPMRAANAVMTVSGQWHGFLRLHYPQHAHKIILARNGVQSSIFMPVSPRRKRNLRRRYGIPEDRFVVGFSCKRTSNSHDRKGLDVLERLVGSRELSSAGIHWLLRGPGWNEFVSAIGASNLTYLPYAFGEAMLARSYQAMDAYLITSRIEGGQSRFWKRCLVGSRP